MYYLYEFQSTKHLQQSIRRPGKHIGLGVADLKTHLACIDDSIIACPVIYPTANTCLLRHTATMKYSPVVMIYNPNSTGPSKKYAATLKRKLAKQYPRLDIQLIATKHAGHAEELAYNIAHISKTPLIISSSGDGGYNEVVNGALRAQNEGATPTCAVLAAGNANDHSRTVQNESLYKAIVANRVKKLDVLKMTVQNGTSVEERYAHSYIGLGLTPVVATELNKTDLNAIKELWIVLRTFYKYRPFKIRHNNRTKELDSIIFANIGEMAKVLTIATDAKPDDGVFEVVTFPHAHKLRLIRQLVKATVTGLEKPNKHKKYQFTILKNMPVQLDGEVKTLAKDSVVTVTSEHKMLRTIV